MASYVNSVGIAAEARRVFVDPRNAATYLRRHHGKIQLDLVVIHEDQGTLVMRRRTNAALLSESRRGSHGQCRGEHCPPADVVFTFHRYSPEFSRVSLHCVAQTYRVARSLGRMQCLLLALNGHIEAGWRCPLSGVKRTKSKQGALS